MGFDVENQPKTLTLKIEPSKVLPNPRDQNERAQGPVTIVTECDLIVN